MYLPGVTSGFIPGILILHGGIYLTNREFFVWATQDGTPENNGEGVRRSAISIPQAVQAGWTMRMLLVLCSVAPLSYRRSARNMDAGLTRYFRLRAVVRIDWGGWFVELTPRRDNQSTPSLPRT